MNVDLLQGMIDIVFKGNLLYLSPILFVLMAAMFGETLIGLISTSISASDGNRRSRY